MISFILWHVFANKDLDKVPTNLLNCQTLLSIYNYFLRQVPAFQESITQTRVNWPLHHDLSLKFNISF